MTRLQETCQRRLNLYPCAQVESWIPLLCSVLSLIVVGFVGELIVGTVGDIDLLFGTACFGLQSGGVVLLVGLN
jgi:hypothetical protein